MKAFLDTNVLVYAATTDARKHVAVECLQRGGIASVQVLNEFVNVARRKFNHPWPLIETALAEFRAALDDIVPVTLTTHVSALALAQGHRLLFYDALIVAAALEAGCDTLYSEDLQHGATIGALRIHNPFVKGPP